jgi:hypothetical protein
MSWDVPDRATDVERIVRNAGYNTFITGALVDEVRYFCALKFSKTKSEPLLIHLTQLPPPPRPLSATRRLSARLRASFEF